MAFEALLEAGGGRAVLLAGQWLGIPGIARAIQSAERLEAAAAV